MLVGHVGHHKLKRWAIRKKLTDPECGGQDRQDVVMREILVWYLPRCQRIHYLRNESGIV